MNQASRIPPPACVPRRRVGSVASSVVIAPRLGPCRERGDGQSCDGSDHDPCPRKYTPLWRVSARLGAVIRLCRSVRSRSSRGELGSRHAASATTTGSDEMPAIAASSGWPRSDMRVPGSVPLQPAASTAVETVSRTTDRCRFVRVFVIDRCIRGCLHGVARGPARRRRAASPGSTKGRAIQGRSATGRGADDRRSRCDRSTASLPLARTQQDASLRGERRRGAGGERKEQRQVAADAAAGPFRRVAVAGPHVRP